MLLVIVSLAGLSGNLIAGWLDKTVWTNWATNERLIWTAAGLILMLVVQTFLEIDFVLPWNWWWHRYWFLQSIIRDNHLLNIEKKYSQLDLLSLEGKRSFIMLSGTMLPEKEELISYLERRIKSRELENCKILIVGEPGSGKTTGLERTTLSLARKAIRHLGFASPIPVLIRMGSYQQENIVDYVANQIESSVGGNTGRALKKGLPKLLKAGKVVVILDALDEAFGRDGKKTFLELDQFLNHKDFAKTTTIISGRALDLPIEHFQTFEYYEIQPLRDDAVRSFIKVYKRQEDSEEEIWKSLEQNNFLEPAGMARNPFWLTLILNSGSPGRKQIQAT